MGAAAGVVGPAVFTGAWIVSSLRQSVPAAEVQISGLAAADARDPWIMIGGFLVLGVCSVAFGESAHRAIGGAGPRLIEGAGVLTIAAGLLRRDHMLLTRGPVSWHNHAHDVISALIYADLIIAQVMLARGFGRDAGMAWRAWRAWRAWLLGSAAATTGLVVAFAADTSAPDAGVLQRLLVSVPLAAMGAIAVRLTRRRAGSPAPDQRLAGPRSGGLRSGGLRSAGLRSAGLRSAGLRSAGLRSAGLRSAGLRSGGLRLGAGHLGMVAPGRHRGQVGQRLALDLLPGRAGVASRLPGDHPREALVERLELAVVVGAVAAVPAALDRHAAALTVHGVLLMLVRRVGQPGRPGR
jgi:hypothetical protein